MSRSDPRLWTAVGVSAALLSLGLLHACGGDPGSAGNKAAYLSSLRAANIEVPGAAGTEDDAMADADTACNSDLTGSRLLAGPWELKVSGVVETGALIRAAVTNMCPGARSFMDYPPPGPGPALAQPTAEAPATSAAPATSSTPVPETVAQAPASPAPATGGNIYVPIPDAPGDGYCEACPHPHVHAVPYPHISRHRLPLLTRANLALPNLDDGPDAAAAG